MLCFHSVRHSDLFNVTCQVAPLNCVTGVNVAIAHCLVETRAYFLIVKTHQEVLLRLAGRTVLEHQWRRADQTVLQLQVDHVLPAVLKDQQSLEVRASQKDPAAQQAPENLSTSKQLILAEIIQLRYDTIVCDTKYLTWTKSRRVASSLYRIEPVRKNYKQKSRVTEFEPSLMCKGSSED